MTPLGVFLLESQPQPLGVFFFRGIYAFRRLIMYSKAAAAEIAAFQILEDVGCKSYLLPVRLVMPHVLASKKGLRRLELAHPHMCRLYPELVSGEYLDWYKMPSRAFCDYVLGIDVVVELPDGTVLGVDVTTQKSLSREALDKEEKLVGLRPLLKTIGIDTVLVLSLQLGEIGYKAISPSVRQKVKKEMEKRLLSINPRKWVRVWEMTIQE